MLISGEGSKLRNKWMMNSELLICTIVRFTEKGHGLLIFNLTHVVLHKLHETNINECALHQSLETLAGFL